MNEQTGMSESGRAQTERTNTAGLVAAVAAGVGVVFVLAGLPLLGIVAGPVALGAGVVGEHRARRGECGGQVTSAVASVFGLCLFLIAIGA